MIIIYWLTLWIGTIVFFLCYIKMRERVPTAQRDTAEKILMVVIVVLLIVDVGFVVRERRNMTYEINDCIRFFRYYPHHQNATEFNFINKCYDYYDEEDIENLRESGINYKRSKDYWASQKPLYNFSGVNLSQWN